ncbi:MAG TPA: hypothetical protein VIA09_04380 [Nitrososphaeraceae archaeon]
MGSLKATTDIPSMLPHMASRKSSVMSSSSSMMLTIRLSIDMTITPPPTLVLSQLWNSV